MSDQDSTLRLDPVLCLSGGGFRATLFHLGVLIRLNELGVLSKLATITSVSGGSILNGWLAANWAQLIADEKGVFKNFQSIIANPVQDYCSRDLRTKMVVGKRLNPLNWRQICRDRFSVSANFLADEYDLWYQKQLCEIPEPNETTPRFIFCATNVLSGACWQFHGGEQPRMGDFYQGYCDASDISIGHAVAASSAFTPGFSAFRLASGHREFSRIDGWGFEREPANKVTEPLRESCIYLTDGGVYDNLGVEPIWNRCKMFLISDAGKPFDRQAGHGQGIISRLTRAASIAMEQVASVRKRWFVANCLAGSVEGAIWLLNTPVSSFNVDNKQGYSRDCVRAIESIRTDLNSFTPGEQGCLINHGYSLADAGVRAYALKLCEFPTGEFVWPHLFWVEKERVVKALKYSSKRKIVTDLLAYFLGSSCRIWPSS